MLPRSIYTFFRKPFFSDYRTLLSVWMICALYTAFKNIYENNFLIFRQVFWHLVQQKPLYIEYPNEYSDINLYGPLFAYIIAPFSIMPIGAGHLCWQIALTCFLFYTIKTTTLQRWQKIFILWFCAHELLTALFLSQFNIAIAAIILLTFYCIEKDKDCLATLAIAIGVLTKIYGIVGLAFFFFSRHKTKFIVSLCLWMVSLTLLPIIVCDANYLFGQYAEWGQTLIAKNERNLFAPDENISLLGIVRKVSGISTYSDLWLIIPGLTLFALPYLRFRQYKEIAFRQAFLASVLMFVVLFSTGSESYGYITALLGVAIWYTTSPWKRGKWDIALLCFVFILTSLSPGDLFPRNIREEWVKPYSLKALPVAIVWFRLCYEMITKNYTTHNIHEEKDNNPTASIQ